MANRKEIDISVRNLLVKLRKQNKSYGEIPKILQLSRPTVQKIVKNYNNTNTTENKPRSGRPKKLSRRDINVILRELNKNPQISAPKLAEHIAVSTSRNVHPKTIQNVLHNNGFRSRIARKKPLISGKNRKLRLEIAKRHIDKGMDYWNRVLFTDEPKYNIFGSDGRSRVRRKTNTALDSKNIIPTEKHGGGNVMVWELWHHLE